LPCQRDVLNSPSGRGRLCLRIQICNRLAEPIDFISEVISQLETNIATLDFATPIEIDSILYIYIRKIAATITPLLKQGKMTSTNIIPASGANFAQQGSIDWVALSNSQITFSVNVLARLSRAGIEPITIGMGRALCLGFELKPSAQEEISMALSRLKAFQSFGDMVYFGFGVRHIIFELQHTEQGSTCVGLCACLRANYSSWYGALVLRKLCMARGAPRNLTPSLRQWEALLDSCGGVLGSKCRFTQLVDAFSRLLS
jgi:hypothetical protein